MGRLVPLPAGNRRKPRGGGRPLPPGPPRRPFRPANDNRPPRREILLRLLFWAAFAALAALWLATA